MSLVPIDLPPGFARNTTRYATAGRWWDGNLIRWVDGALRPIGGWTRVSLAPLSRKARALFSWRTNSGGRWLAIGTSNQLVVTRADGQLFDITPTAFSTGSDDAVEQLGFGGGNYGVGTYGTARAGGTFVAPMTWQLDSWGDNLVGCARNDGKLYQWALGQSNPAAVIANAPTSCLGLLVTDQRHIIAFGAGSNRRKFQWCDKENNTNWTVSATSEAGSLELQTPGEYMRAWRVRGINLVLTDVDAHVIEFIGQPYIYRRSRVADGCGLIGPNAGTIAGSDGVWMGSNKFWMFDGGVHEISCEVADYVFGDINLFQAHKFTCGYNSTFNEVWWWYCSAGASEPDRYVAWNKRDGHWTFGRMARTAWQDKAVFPQPLAMGTDNQLYRHEEGWLADGASRLADIFVASGALELDVGDRIGNINQVLPDEKNQGAVTVSFTTKYTPTDVAEYSFGPYVVRSSGYTDARASGRQVVMTLRPTADADFRVGRFRFDIIPGGNR